jgi:SAM-dependent methyltransferase
MMADKTITYSLNYYSSDRMAQYYHQVQAVRDAGVKTVLEVGPGPGVITHVLRTAGIAVTTCGLGETGKLDILADVRNLPLPDQAAEFTLCCQVLEHMPFADLPRALAELKRVTRGRILISIPYASHAIYGIRKWPGGRRRSWVLHFPWLPAKTGMTTEHFWEMGRKGFSKKAILKIIRVAGLAVLEDFTPADSPGNQYFLLIPAFATQP